MLTSRQVSPSTSSAKSSSKSRSSSSTPAPRSFTGWATSPAPRDEFEIYYPKLQTILQPKTRPLVLYCASTSCEDSALVEKALRNLGYTRISIFHGGWAEWTQNALPEEKQ